MVYQYNVKRMGPKLHPLCLLIWQICDDLIQCAVQYFTQRVQCVGRHRFAGFQSSYRGAADPALKLERVGGGSALFHGLP